jgi:hypothetical protein
MTYVRIGFVGAFLLLLVGGYTAKKAVAPYFSAAAGRSTPAIRATATPRTVAHRIAPAATAIVVKKTATPTATAIPTATPGLTPTVVLLTAGPTTTHPHRAPARRPVRHARTHRAVARRRKPIPTFTPVPTATAEPTPQSSVGEVALSNYWVNSQRVQSGQVIAIGYVIRNDTHTTERVMLGASLKARWAASWTDAINDPNHDVVALVPPGATVHVRYFALPPGLRPGKYDVAWGLRDATTGQRLGLAFAPSVVTVTR